ncbi:MAG: hypothetical protein WA705_01665 [Candidatus Ozemobacteraceae bacterium]
MRFSSMVFVLFVIFLVLLVGQPCSADDNLSLSFNNVPALQIIQVIAEKAKTPFITVGEKVKKPVSISVKDISAKDAFAAVAKAAEMTQTTFEGVEIFRADPVAESGNQTVPGLPSEKLSMDFKDVEIAEILKMVGEQLGISIKTVGDMNANICSRCANSDGGLMLRALTRAIGGKLDGKDKTWTLTKP